MNDSLYTIGQLAKDHWCRRTPHSLLLQRRPAAASVAHSLPSCAATIQTQRQAASGCGSTRRRARCCNDPSQAAEPSVQHVVGRLAFARGRSL